MKMKDFLKQEYEQAQKSDSFVTIAKITIEIAWRCGILPNVDYVINTGDSGDKTKAEAKHEEMGGQYDPNYGVLLTIYGDNVPTHPQGKFSWGDWKQFLEFNPRLKADEQEEVGDHALPAKVFIDTVPEFEAGKPYWAKLQKQTDYHREALAKLDRAKKRKGNYPHDFYTVAEIYPNEAAAKKEAEKIKERFATTKGDNASFSKTAKANYNPIESLVACAEEIHLHLSKAQQGEAFMSDAENYPLPQPPTLPNLKKYIANIYSIEASDIDLLRVEVPFG